MWKYCVNESKCMEYPILAYLRRLTEGVMMDIDVVLCWRVGGKVPYLPISWPIQANNLGKPNIAL
jgi:hypothetical protein